MPYIFPVYIYVGAGNRLGFDSRDLLSLMAWAHEYHRHNRNGGHGGNGNSPCDGFFL